MPAAKRDADRALRDSGLPQLSNVSEKGGSAVASAALNALRQKLSGVLKRLPDVERDVWQTDTDACCAARKVEPLQRALAACVGLLDAPLGVEHDVNRVGSSPRPIDGPT